mmetsp:Transcript_42874/g.84056  ORF Transcript_42874/g.84056 Transcript_42874/m.84056 type:complete len:134 (-) Transcript_42874:522-923(-)
MEHQSPATASCLCVSVCVCVCVCVYALMYQQNKALFLLKDSIPLLPLNFCLQCRASIRGSHAAFECCSNSANVILSLPSSCMLCNSWSVGTPASFISFTNSGSFSSVSSSSCCDSILSLLRSARENTDINVGA